MLGCPSSWPASCWCWHLRVPGQPLLSHSHLWAFLSLPAGSLPSLHVLCLERYAGHISKEASRPSPGGCTPHPHPKPPWLLCNQNSKGVHLRDPLLGRPKAVEKGLSTPHRWGSKRDSGQGWWCWLRGMEGRWVSRPKERHSPPCAQKQHTVELQVVLLNTCLF